MALHINLFGAPGAGKSTARAEIFSMLKRRGVECEEVYEFAKKLVWSKRVAELSCQPYVFGKQLRDMMALEGQVDVVITDCPLFLSYFYGKKYCGDVFTDTFYQSALEQFQRYPALNFFIERSRPYSANGRNETEEESNAIADELRNALVDHGVNFTNIPGTEDGSRLIVSKIMEATSVLR